MNIQDYIKVYENVVDEKLCDLIMSARLDYKSSTFSDHDGTIENSEDRVIMDDFWITDKIEAIYNPLLDCYLKVARLYEEDFPILELKKSTWFRINKYGPGGFMSEHTDNIHHSHGQKWGFPQVSALLYLNDDYEGGEFIVAGKEIKPNKGSSVIFPSNFMYPHEAKVVKRGVRWSIIAWLM